MKKKILCTRDISEIRWQKASEVVETLTQLIEELGDGTIEVDAGYDGSFDIEFSYEREETDKEHADRMGAVERAMAAERAQYERLKAKYEGGKS